MGPMLTQLSKDSAPMLLIPPRAALTFLKMSVHPVGSSDDMGASVVRTVGSAVADSITTEGGTDDDSEESLVGSTVMKNDRSMGLKVKKE